MNSKTQTRLESRRFDKNFQESKQSELSRASGAPASSMESVSDALNVPLSRTELTTNDNDHDREDSLNRLELLELLNGVLEDVRAEAQMSGDIETLDVHREHRALFRHLRTEQIRSIMLLLREIERLEGQPSLRTGPLGDRPPPGAPVSVHLRCFSNRQKDFHERLDQALPRIEETRLQEVLSDLQKRHTQCIEHCTALTDNRWIGHEHSTGAVCERSNSRVQDDMNDD